jgi:hypothetical protein
MRKRRPSWMRQPSSFQRAIAVGRADTPASDGLLAATLYALGDDGYRSEVDAAASAARSGLIAQLLKSGRVARHGRIAQGKDESPDPSTALFHLVRRGCLVVGRRDDRFVVPNRSPPGFGALNEVLLQREGYVRWVARRYRSSPRRFQCDVIVRYSACRGRR